MAKWQCCPLREATSAALPYTRRAGSWAVHKSTRPVQPRSTQPQPPAPAPSPKGTLLCKEHPAPSPSPQPKRNFTPSTARSTQPQSRSPPVYSENVKRKQLASDATSPRFQSMWLLLSRRVCKLLCPWAPKKGPLHIMKTLSSGGRRIKLEESIHPLVHPSARRSRTGYNMHSG